MGGIFTSFTDELRAALSTVAERTPPDWTNRWMVNNPHEFSLREPSSNNVGPLVAYLNNQAQGGDTSGPGVLWTWDRFNTAGIAKDDTDILVLFRLLTGVSSVANNPFWIATRASGDGSAGTTENGYTLNVDRTGTDGVEFSEWTAGTETTIGTRVAQSFTDDAWYYLQMRVEGDQLSARWWAYADTAPVIWQIPPFTDATHSTAGWVGVGSDSGSVGDIELDFIWVATDGEAAQFFPSGQDAPTLNVITATPTNVATDATSFLVFIGEPNKSVDWAITAGDGSLTVLTDTTDAAGKAFAKYNPGTVGTKTIEVTYGT